MAAAKPILARQQTPGSIKTLRAFRRRKLPAKIPTYLLRQLFNEGVRTAMTLFGAALDDALMYRLSQSLAYELNEPSFQHVFRDDGPLGSFGSRIEIGHLFGVIDDHTRHQLSICRELRNVCAHAHHEVSWDTLELVAVMRRLIPEPSLAVLDQPIDASWSIKPRTSLQSVFHVEFMRLYYGMTFGSEEAALAACEVDLKEIGSRSLLDGYGVLIAGRRGRRFLCHFDFPDSPYIIEGAEGHATL